jgi:hypothetical protein
MIKRLIFGILALFLSLQLTKSQEHPLIYGLKMNFLNDSANNVAVLSLQLRMKHIDALTSLQVELGSDSVTWNLYTKSISIIKNAGNYYLEADNSKEMINGSLGTIQFDVPVEIAKRVRYARVYGKPQTSGDNVMFYQF